MAYVLAMVGSPWKFLSFSGWSTSKKGALEFRSKEAAIEYAEANGYVGALAELVVPPPPPGMAAPYNPFSTRLPGRG